jgi:hypothetical protein
MRETHRLSLVGIAAVAAIDGEAGTILASAIM